MPRLQLQPPQQFDFKFQIAGWNGRGVSNSIAKPLDYLRTLGCPLFFQEQSKLGFSISGLVARKSAWTVTLMLEKAQEKFKLNTGAAVIVSLKRLIILCPTEETFQSFLWPSKARGSTWTVQGTTDSSAELHGGRSLRCERTENQSARTTSHHLVGFHPESVYTYRDQHQVEVNSGLNPVRGPVLSINS